ncbi:hypothetical protein DRB96_03025 [Streptomyces sp. ICC1]|nr:hypothetical protein DRB89_04090 [Streptomyces sp. ICC4]AWZ11459.1 hypothetical protein DRB96_03025 [Streptomyces sp. ICC1]
MRASGRLGGGGLGMWRERDGGEWKATAGEIAEDLVLPEVPHQVAAAFRPPLAKSGSQRPRRVEEVRIVTGDDRTTAPALLPRQHSCHVRLRNSP